MADSVETLGVDLRTRVQDTQRSIYSTRFEEKWHNTESNLKNLKIEPSSCRCGRKAKKTSKSVFRTLRKSRIQHRFPKGHWSFLRPGTEEKL